MKATLEFDLPQEDYDLMVAEKGAHAFCAFRDLDNYLRAVTKYGDGANPGREETFGEIRARLWEILSEWKIDLDG